ncbi:hypothetical protein [Mesorhizobium sp. ES1-1]|uniref:hypothetical protein n=1 Tax=Mesorhizobium sp. ES1-1 TaxID=2876629 RepID=UPI001CCE0AFF|nr:hypothetical protein [Mesorhizobium sp. ES1-1]MBZ9674563.1 hypothetical protein [Mesorhizobium sp. ES1-1]
MKFFKGAAWLLVLMAAFYGGSKAAEAAGYPQVSDYLSKQAADFGEQYQAAKATVISPTEPAAVAE